MKHFFFFALLVLSGSLVQGQSQFQRSACKMKPTEAFDNIHVQPLMSDEKASSFVIWIKKEVKLHKHLHHSEHVYVLKGKGEMLLGNQKFDVSKGDVVFIPMDTPHSVKVKRGTLKVISVQAPRFVGKDRIFLE